MIEFDTSQLQRVQRELAHIPGAAKKAMAYAINRAAATAKSEAAREIRKTYYISGKAVSDVIKISKKASPSSPAAIIRVKSGPLALTKFKITPATPYAKPGSSQTITRAQGRAATKRRATPVIARVKKGGGGQIKHAFIARMRSGHVGVFNRAGKKPLPMNQRYGPSVAQMAGNPSVTRHIEQAAMAKLEERLQIEIDKALTGAFRG